MKRILMNNALESWALAIFYCNEIMEGKATLGKRKYFVSTLQNAIELFIKQYMLNICDYRVCDVKNMKANGEPMASYLDAKDLNQYFYNLHNNDEKSMEYFYSAEFNKLVDWQKKLFEGYYTEHSTAKNVIGDGLATLKKLRNSETHFFIDECDFLKEDEFVKLYNLMVVFYDMLVHYHLINIWGEPYGEDKRFAFDRTQMTSFSYKKQLKKSSTVAKIKQVIEEEIFPVGIGDNPYEIAKFITSIEGESDSLEFEEIWVYIQMLLQYKLLSGVVEENGEVIDGEMCYQPYITYTIDI